MAGRGVRSGWYVLELVVAASPEMGKKGWTGAGLADENERPTVPEKRMLVLVGNCMLFIGERDRKAEREEKSQEQKRETEQ